MKDLVDRARAAMNLILVASLVLIWVSLQPPPQSTVVLAKQIIHNLSLSQEVALSGEFHHPEAVASINVLDLLNASTESLEANLSGPRGKESLPAELTELDGELEELAAKGGDEAELEKLSIEQLRELVLHMQVRKDILKARSESLRLRAAAVQIEELQNIHAPFRDDEALTFQQLDERLQSKVKVPFIEQEVPGERALVLIGVGLAGPYLYLLSTIWAMRFVPRSNGTEDSRGWVFFHPHWLGLAVGGAWLALPVAALFVSGMLRQQEFSLIDSLKTPAFWCYLFLGVLAALCIWQARKERQHWLPKEQPSSEAASGKMPQEPVHILEKADSTKE